MSAKPKPTLESELPRSRHIYALDLPKWMHELCETEAKQLGITEGRYMSKFVATMFNLQRRKS